MSVKVMTWVFTESKSTGCARLVALALADRANDEGDECHPSITTIAKKARVSTRTVQRALGELVEIGELEVEVGGGIGRADRKTNAYRFTFTTRQDVATREADGVTPGTERGDNDDANGATSTPERGDTAVALDVLYPSGDTSLIPAASHADVVDALIEAFDMNPAEMSKPEFSRYGAAAKSLRDIGADHREIPQRLAAYRLLYPGAASTPHALVGRWGECKPERAYRQTIAPQPSKVDVQLARIGARP